MYIVVLQILAMFKQPQYVWMKWALKKHKQSVVLSFEMYLLLVQILLMAEDALSDAMHRLKHTAHNISTQ